MHLSVFGRSSETRTHGLCVPNAARYQLRYTPKENGSRCCRLVAEEGFEPSQCESESQVLPLHNSALHSRRIAEVLYYYTKKFARCQHLFLRKSTRNKIPLRKICRVPGFGRVV